LESCVGRPMSRNSVFDGLRERKLEDIQDDMSEIVSCSSRMLFVKWFGENEMKSCVSSA